MIRFLKELQNLSNLRNLTLRFDKKRLTNKVFEKIKQMLNELKFLEEIRFFHKYDEIIRSDLELLAKEFVEINQLYKIIRINRMAFDKKFDDQICQHFNGDLFPKKGICCLENQLFMGLYY